MPAVLFVCLGNICRSPLAEGILRRQAESDGLSIDIDSAGIGNWHAGEFPDPRAIRIGEAHGCQMTMRSRQVRMEDFDRFDLIVPMDYSNMRDLIDWPGSRLEKIQLARSYDPAAEDDEVPDPYYGTLADFEGVAQMLERVCQGILDEIKSYSSEAS